MMWSGVTAGCLVEGSGSVAMGESVANMAFRSLLILSHFSLSENDNFNAELLKYLLSYNFCFNSFKK